MYANKMFYSFNCSYFSNAWFILYDLGLGASGSYKTACTKTYLVAIY